MNNYKSKYIKYKKKYLKLKGGTKQLERNKEQIKRNNEHIQARIEKDMITDIEYLNNKYSYNIESKDINKDIEYLMNMVRKFFTLTDKYKPRKFLNEDNLKICNYLQNYKIAILHFIDNIYQIFFSKKDIEFLTYNEIKHELDFLELIRKIHYKSDRSFLDVELEKLLERIPTLKIFEREKGLKPEPNIKYLQELLNNHLKYLNENTNIKDIYFNDIIKGDIEYLKHFEQNKIEDIYFNDKIKENTDYLLYYISLNYEQFELNKPDEELTYNEIDAELNYLILIRDFNIKFDNLGFPILTKDELAYISNRINDLYDLNPSPSRQIKKKNQHDSFLNYIENYIL